MPSSIPPSLPPKPPQPSPGQDNSWGSSIWKRVKEVVAPIFENIHRYRAPEMTGSELISFIQALGYKSSEGGICCGLALMAIQAILCNDFDTYEFRLQRIATLIDKYKEMSGNQDFLELVKKDASILKKDYDLVAFFDGIELYQNSGLYSHLFENPLSDIKYKDFLNTVVPITSPGILQAKGGIDIAEQFIRIYDTKDLKLHLKKLKNLFKESASCPIALSGNGHVIVVTYDVKKSSWTVIDHGHITKSLSSDKLASYVYRALTPSSKLGKKTNLCAITTMLFTTKDQSQSLQKILESHSPDLLDIPQFSKEKLAFASRDEFCRDVISYNDLTMFKAMLEQGVLFSASDKLDKTIISCFWHFFVEVVLKDKNPAFTSLIVDTMGIAFVEKKDSNGDSFLLAAIKDNNIPIVEVLLKAGANLNQRDLSGKTPLQIALNNNFVELAALLAPPPQL